MTTVPKMFFMPFAMVVLIALSACNREGSQREPLAKIVAGAVIETRDEPSSEELRRETRVVVLGTGTPIPDARRAGPSIAVIHKGETYLFDIGAGSIRNAVTARYKYDIPSLYPLQICCVFITHMHSDHTMDLSELAFDLWWRRVEPLRVWGPTGLKQMTAGMYAMMAPDIETRSSGSQPLPNPKSYEVDVTEITAGVVFEKEDLVIEAFSVSHGEVEPAFGYRITTAEKTIVISGDTAYSEKLLEMSRGADLLFHEVISDSGLANTSEYFQAYHKKSHTTASDVARLASEAKPDKLVLYHALFYGVPEDLIVDEVRAGYDGEVVLADDLDLF